MRDPDAWPLTPLLDAQLADPASLALSPSWGALLTALFTGLALLLLTDLTFRVVVRARRGPPPSPTGPAAAETVMHRRAALRAVLLRRASNPLYWPAVLLSMRKRRRIRKELRRQRAAPPAPLPPPPGAPSMPSSSSPDMSAHGSSVPSSPGMLHDEAADATLLPISDHPLDDLAHFAQLQPPERPPLPRLVPQWQRMIIGTLGLSLVAAHFTLLFLAAWPHARVRVDVTSGLRAFELVPRADISDSQPRLIRRGMADCTAYPLVTGPGFAAPAGFSQVCATMSVHREDGVSPSRSAERAFVAVGYGPRGSPDVYFRVVTPYWAARYTQRFAAVALRGGESFYTAPVRPPSADDAADAMRAALQNVGFNVSATRSGAGPVPTPVVDASSGAAGTDVAWLALAHNGMRVPDDVAATFRSTYPDAPGSIDADPTAEEDEAVAMWRSLRWNYMLGSALRASLSLTADAAEAFAGDAQSGPFLKDADVGALVVRTRARLSVLASIVLAGSLALVWAVVAVRLRWRADVSWRRTYGDNDSRGGAHSKEAQFGGDLDDIDHWVEYDLGGL